MHGRRRGRSMVILCALLFQLRSLFATGDRTQSELAAGCAKPIERVTRPLFSRGLRSRPLAIARCRLSSRRLGGQETYRIAPHGLLLLIWSSANLSHPKAAKGWSEHKTRCTVSAPCVDAAPTRARGPAGTLCAGAQGYWVVSS
jgi:hypothetical protein